MLRVLALLLELLATPALRLRPTEAATRALELPPVHAPPQCARGVRRRNNVLEA
jgi:hypothetical protein